jgi:hypothetical protein
VNRVILPWRVILPGPRIVPLAQGCSATSLCETVLVVKDEALQRSGFDYADRLAPAPTLSPWLICFTGSAM